MQVVKQKGHADADGDAKHVPELHDIHDGGVREVSVPILLEWPCSDPTDFDEAQVGRDKSHPLKPFPLEGAWDQCKPVFEGVEVLICLSESEASNPTAKNVSEL